MYLPRTQLEKLSFGRKGLKSILVHTPKCGGSFVGRAFEPYRKKCITLTEPSLAGHKGWAEYGAGLEALGEDIDSYETVAVIRNPFAWQVSWYTYIRAPKGARRSGYPLEHDLFQKMSFSDYVQWLDDPDAQRGERFEMGRELRSWVCDESGEIRVGTLLRQESLTADLTAFRDKFGLLLKLPTKPVNVSNTQDYRSFYKDADVDIIARRHAKDCALFGYAFDESPLPG